jgi:hypothetical protein
MRFGTWTVTSLYRSGSLIIVSRKLAKYKLDLVGVQEVKWDKRGTVRAEDYIFVCGKKWVFKKWDRETWIGLIWLRVGTAGKCL